MAGAPAAPPRRELHVIERVHAEPAAAVLAAQGVDRAQGLSDAEVLARRRLHGPNRLLRIRPRSAWAVLRDQFTSLLVALLAVAAALSVAVGQWAEGVAIAAVLVVNAAVGFASELGALRSMEALRRLGSVRTTVRRGGALRIVDAEELVPGDLVVVDGGDVVTADLRLIEASKLQADESALTGESLPVGKSARPVAPDAPTAERTSMLFRGTAVTRGAGEGVVVATGMQTELGRISGLVATARDEETPLEKRLDRLGQRLLWLALAVAALVAAGGLAAGRHWLITVETGIALAVATVPEGLPIIATLALARGMWRMARRNAVVNRLSAVEALGATGIICTDKTGTLTENRMTLVELALPCGVVGVSGEGLATDGSFQLDGRELEADAPLLRRALELGVLCNDASFAPGGDPVGDPLEVALLVAGHKAGIDRRPLLARMPEEREVAFDPELKMMATVHRHGAHHRVAVKGAPEALLPVCERIVAEDGERALDAAGRRAWEEAAAEMAARGLRVLALAERHAERPDEPVYADLAFVGLVGLLDPPRAEVREAIAACRAAGVRVVMVTGDHPATARTIARAVGIDEDAKPRVVLGAEIAGAAPPDDLLDASIFARVAPEQKLALIAAFQARGAIVAMTGDGVNDAPALRKADIGVAMGRRGTEVAREAADVVLRDDAFSTIGAAVREGRIIFGNIRSFVVYLLACNMSEILVVGLATAVSAPLPILPLQILFLNLVTDVFPALALGAGEGPPRVMAEPPRDPRERVLEAPHWLAIAGHGALLTLGVLGALGIGLQALALDERAATTLSFLTLAFAQLWHVFNRRAPDSGWLRNEITANPWVWGALALCSALLVLAVHVPGAARLLQVSPPDLRGWLVVGAMSLAPTLVGEVLAWIVRGGGAGGRLRGGGPSRGRSGRDRAGSPSRAPGPESRPR
jgi:Ca2+-transporting ATPase